MEELEAMVAEKRERSRRANEERAKRLEELVRKREEERMKREFREHPQNDIPPRDDGDGLI